MRFRCHLANVITFTKLTASLSSLGKICWMRLEDGVVRFTIIPDQGTQVWAQLPVDCIFDETTYVLESNTGVINLEVPIGALNRALRSAIGAPSAQLRLTKKGPIPLLALTVIASSWTPGNDALGISENGDDDNTATANSTNFVDDTTAPALGGQSQYPNPLAPLQSTSASSSSLRQGGGGGGPRPPSGPRKRETVITQEIPIKVLHESAIQGLHEPRCRDPDVHIILPSLVQLKSISERFNKLATDAKLSTSSPSSASFLPAQPQSGGSVPKLELSANMHGSLKLGIATDALRISSVWSGLVNPPLDPEQLSQAEIEQLPSERMRAIDKDDEAGWAKVRIDGRDWGRVLSVGRLSPKVVACFINETALILYVYLAGSWNGEDSCLTYYINSYSS